MCQYVVAKDTDTAWENEIGGELTTLVLYTCMLGLCNHCNVMFRSRTFKVLEAVLYATKNNRNVIFK